jgi:hypothetical protein
MWHVDSLLGNAKYAYIQQPLLRNGCVKKNIYTSKMGYNSNGYNKTNATMAQQQRIGISYAVRAKML